jgi:hypothetical protein
MIMAKKKKVIMYKYKGEIIKFTGLMYDGKYCFSGFIPNKFLLLSKEEVGNLELA